MLKKIICITYAIVTIVMATATIIEKYAGTDYVGNVIYGSWWFIALWAILTATGAVYIARRILHRPAILSLHTSFIIILAGALLTHLTSRQDTLHLRMDIPDNSLPFSVTLTKFEVKYHKGTSAPYDYLSHFIITDEGKRTEGMVSMNNIFSYRSYRLYQNSYDDDMQGSTLSVNSDPYGIPVTYLGYAMLFISLIWMIIDKKGVFRTTLRKTARTIVFLPLLMLTIPTTAARTVTKEDAARIERLNINFNNRICPMQTFALEFTKSVTGARSYNGCNATQVLAGFMLFGDEWMSEPVLKVKSKELREQLNIEEYTSVESFFNTQHGGYKLEPYIQEYYRGNNDALHKAAAEIDNKLMLIMQVRNHNLIQIFPYHGIWYSPSDSLPASMVNEQKAYVRNALTSLSAMVHKGKAEESAGMIDNILEYQHRYGGEEIPSSLSLKAERIYNMAPYTTILFIVCLALGIASLLPLFKRYSAWSVALCFTAITALLALRWIISGRIPMANGYETMLTMAWTILLVTLLLYRRFHIIVTFGLLLSGFSLLVSHLSQMDPQINHIMPVLQSPLLSIHVSVIMMSYALLSITAACAVVALLSKKREKEMTQLSILMLYPAMACLGTGIFVGAVWANVSWGNYWSWDPKETWALITFMLYAIPLHRISLPQFNNRRTYHIFILCAFASVVVTYFGVNYLLGGMHSYA